MANYIHSIKVGEITYDIGMKNAVHFHGIANISNFYSNAACTTAATNANIGDDFLWTKGLSIVINGGDPSETQPSDIAEVHLGCMIIPSRVGETTATSYEYVCVEIISGEGTAN
jgi:hypothetical protein